MTFLLEGHNQLVKTMVKSERSVLQAYFPTKQSNSSLPMRTDLMTDNVTE